MGAEIPLGHAAQTLVENLVGHLSYRTVLIQAHNRYLSVVPACHKEIFIILIGRQITAAHAFDAGAV